MNSDTTMRSMRAQLVCFAIMVLFIPMVHQRWATARMQPPPTGEERLIEPNSIDDENHAVDVWVGEEAHEHALVEAFGIRSDGRSFALILDGQRSVTVHRHVPIGDIDIDPIGDEITSHEAVDTGYLDAVVFVPNDSAGNPIPSQVVPLVDDAGELHGLMILHRSVLGGTLTGDFGAVHIAAISSDVEIIPVNGQQQDISSDTPRILTVLSIENTHRDAVSMANAVSDSQHQPDWAQALCKHPDPCVCAANAVFRIRAQACKVGAIGLAIRACLIGGAFGTLIAALILLVKKCISAGPVATACMVAILLIVAAAVAVCLASYIADAKACLLEREADRLESIQACRAKRAAQSGGNG